MNTKRSALPAPNVISDTIDSVEQVTGEFFTSKRAFRARGRELGLTEVGNEKIKPKRYTGSTRAERLAALERAAAEYRAGRRAKQRSR
jgi:hypothetical protein